MEEIIFYKKEVSLIIRNQIMNIYCRKWVLAGVEMKQPFSASQIK